MTIYQLAEALRKEHRIILYKAETKAQKEKTQRYGEFCSSYSPIAKQWLKNIRLNPEEFFNMPPQCTQLFEFISLATIIANKQFKKGLDNLTNVSARQKELQLKNYQDKIIKKVFSSQTPELTEHLKNMAERISDTTKDFVK